MTGLPSAGKTTLAKDLSRSLKESRLSTLILDGDEVRRLLCADLGFEREDRAENIRRVAAVSSLACDQSIVTIVALVSPFRSERIHAASIIGRKRFATVWVDTDLEICKERRILTLNPFDLRDGIPSMYDIGALYEPPDDAIRIIGSGDREENLCKLSEELSKRFGTGTVVA
jgi:adenylylsulfate kinase-like enzyme